MFVSLRIDGVHAKKALIVKLGQIGDVIMAIPAARRLHEGGFSIDWVCGKTSQPLLECYSWITVVPVDDQALFQGNSFARLSVISRLWIAMALRRYDLCLILYYDKRYRFLTLPLRIREMRMLSHRSRLLTLVPGRHHTDEAVRIALGEEDTCRISSSAPIRPDRVDFLASRNVGTGRRVALVPGGGNHLIREQATQRLPDQVLRRWPVEHYVTLARELLTRGFEVVLLGGPQDIWVRSYFQTVRVADCLGVFSLPEAVRACDRCDAVISHDTGPLHLAGLSYAGVIGIFGPTDPATRIPRRDGVVAIWGGQGFACRPCYDGRNFAPCQFNGCMHQVTPELVLRELDRLLEEKDRGEKSAWRVVVP